MSEPASQWDEDPYASPEAQRALQLERARQHRELMKMHPANRFRLMFGQPLLPLTDWPTEKIETPELKPDVE